MTAVLAAACSTNTIYSEYRNLPLQGWEADSACAYTIHIEDTLALYRVTASVRHTHRYPYQNLWLFTSLALLPDTTGQDSTMVLLPQVMRQDTVGCFMADQRGQWLGTGVGDHRERELVVYDGLLFKRSGDYQLSLTQGMYRDTLVGVTEVGLVVEKIAQPYGKE